MATISLEGVTIEFPIYNARARRLTGELFRRAVGGNISPMRRMSPSWRFETSVWTSPMATGSD
jgi:hypothetical protein